MTIQVKICGINSVESADAVVRAGANFAGLMFHPRSPRKLEIAQARTIADRLRGRVRIVAVLADPDDATLSNVVTAVKPDFIQLHGSESAARVGDIRARMALSVIKVIAVAEAADLDAASSYEAVADMLMFDAKAPANATREGGHGAAFDWQILKGRTFSRPWLLAGGLNVGNVARAISISGAPGVDVSSGVETAPGQKSAEMIRAFVEGVRNAQFTSAQT